MEQGSHDGAGTKTPLPFVLPTSASPSPSPGGAAAGADGDPEAEPDPGGPRPRGRRGARRPGGPGADAGPDLSIEAEGSHSLGEGAGQTAAFLQLFGPCFPFSLSSCRRP